MQRNYQFISKLYELLENLIDEGPEIKQNLVKEIRDPINLTFLKVVTRSPFMSINHLNLNDCPFVFDDTKIYYKMYLINS